ncbi:MAG: hypothetical protein ACI959_001592 [Limisphaerales bacterium]|jgi:hypothetical protein
MIVVAQQTRDRFSGNFAAKVCLDSKIESYGDWYLPSKTELGIMHELKDEIGGFVNTNYWSSTGYNVGFVWGWGSKIIKASTFSAWEAGLLSIIRRNFKNLSKRSDNVEYYSVSINYLSFLAVFTAVTIQNSDNE